MSKLVRKPVHTRPPDPAEVEAGYGRLLLAYGLIALVVGLLAAASYGISLVIK